MYKSATLLRTNLSERSSIKHVALTNTANSETLGTRPGTGASLGTAFSTGEKTKLNPKNCNRYGMKKYVDIIRWEPPEDKTGGASADRLGCYLIAFLYFTMWFRQTMSADANTMIFGIF
jgi:hypothetical protein